jgi:hypothetical protein
MLASLRTAAAVLSAVLLVACSGAGTRSPDSVPALGFLYIAFENGTAETATVFLESFPTESVALGTDAGPRRLGRVRPSAIQTFRVQAPPTEFAVTASFEALGDAETDRMRAQAGDTVMVATQEGGSLTARVRPHASSSSRSTGADIGTGLVPQGLARSRSRNSTDGRDTTETVG